MLVGIGIGVLLLIAAAVVFILKRRGKPPVPAGGEEPAAPVVAPGEKADYMAKLKESLQRKKKESKGG